MCRNTVVMAVRGAAWQRGSTEMSFRTWRSRTRNSNRTSVTSSKSWPPSAGLQRSTASALATLRRNLRNYAKRLVEKQSFLLNSCCWNIHKFLRCSYCFLLIFLDMIKFPSCGHFVIICRLFCQNDQQRQDITEYKLQLQTQRNMMVSRNEDTDITAKLKKKNKDLSEAMEELQVGFFLEDLASLKRNTLYFNGIFILGHRWFYKSINFAVAYYIFYTMMDSRFKEIILESLSWLVNLSVYILTCFEGNYCHIFLVKISSALSVDK